MNWQKNNISVWLSLFSSSGTLVCCALPALFVALGAGAVLSSLVSAVPAIVILSEYKVAVFVFAGVMLAGSGYMQWRNRYAPCPTDPVLAAACTKTRRLSQWVYGASVVVFVTGGFFAFVLPLFEA